MAQSISGSYPVQVSFAYPGAFQRVHLLLRIGVWIVLGFLSNSLQGLFYFAGPVITAVLVAQRGGDQFHERYDATYVKVVAFLTGFNAYLMLGTDEFPSWGGDDGAVRYRVQPSGTPTVGSALVRLIMVIPHAIALFVVGIAALVAGFVAAVFVLFTESVPHGLWRFLMGVVAWEARVLSYYLSMVDEYPPFSLQLEEGPAS